MWSSLEQGPAGKSQSWSVGHRPVRSTKEMDRLSKRGEASLSMSGVVPFTALGLRMCIYNLHFIPRFGGAAGNPN